MTHNASNAGGGDPSVQGAPLLTFAVHWRLAFKMISRSKIYEYSSQSSDRTLLAQREGGSGSGEGVQCCSLALYRICIVFVMTLKTLQETLPIDPG